jgi:hypothetical protein
MKISLFYGFMQNPIDKSKYILKTHNIKPFNFW